MELSAGHDNLVLLYEKSKVSLKKEKQANNKSNNINYNFTNGKYKKTVLINKEGAYTLNSTCLICGLDEIQHITDCTDEPVELKSNKYMVLLAEAKQHSDAMRLKHNKFLIRIANSINNNEIIPNEASYILRESEKYMEGSFNPYGNGQWEHYFSDFMLLITCIAFSYDVGYELTLGHNIGDELYGNISNQEMHSYNGNTDLTKAIKLLVEMIDMLLVEIPEARYNREIINEIKRIFNISNKVIGKTYSGTNTAWSNNIIASSTTPTYAVSTAIAVLTGQPIDIVIALATPLVVVYGVIYLTINSTHFINPKSFTSEDCTDRKSVV